MAVVEPVLFIRDIDPSDLSASSLEIRESSIQNLAVFALRYLQRFRYCVGASRDDLRRRQWRNGISLGMIDGHTVLKERYKGPVFGGFLLWNLPIGRSPSASWKMSWKVRSAEKAGSTFNTRSRGEL